MKRLPTFPTTLLAGLAAVLLAGSTHAEVGRAGGASTVFGSPDAQSCYLQTKFDIQRTGSALSVCTDALATRRLARRDRARTLVNRATNLNNLKRFEAALTDLEKALQLEPQLAEAFVTRGNAFLLQGAAKMALAEYDRALSLDLRERHAGLVNRGLTYHALNKHEDAYNDFRAAAEILPDWVLPQEFIAQYQKQFGFK